MSGVRDVRDWWQGLSRRGRIVVIVLAVLAFGAIGSALGLGEEEATTEASSDPTTTTAPADERTTTTTSVGAAGDDDSLFVPDLDAGDCIEDAGEEAFSVPKVDCTEPHAFEVTGFHDLEGDDDAYPGPEAMATAAEGPCAETFADHVGATPEESDLSSLPYLFPTEAGWADGSREVVCVAHADDGSLLDSSIEDRG